jgi:hypothetical protein
MQLQAMPREVLVQVNVLDPPGAERAGPPHQAVHFIALVEEELGQVGPVLARDAGDQSFPHG